MVHTIDPEKHVMAKISRRPMNEQELLDDHLVSHNELPTVMSKLVDEGIVEVTSNNPLTWGIKH